MREPFPEYYQLSLAQIDTMSTTAVVAFDASFLLDLYRYSADTAKDMFSVLEGLGDQVWLPHQAALEFHRNRVGVLASLRSRHAELLKQLKVDGEKLVSGVRSACLKHPLLDADKLTAALKAALEVTEAEISAASDKHPKATLLLEDDLIWSKLASIFDKKVGPEYSQEQLQEIEREGKRRFGSAIPPGFKDEKSKEYPFGDFIIWRQLIDHCKNEKRPAFFVSSDVKQDWWLEQSGKRLGPLPALRKEFLTDTGQDFHLYETMHFIKIYAPKYKVSPEKSLSEIRKVRAQRTGAANLPLRNMLKERSHVSDYLHAQSSLKEKLDQFSVGEEMRRAMEANSELSKLRGAVQEAEAVATLREVERSQQYLAENAGVREFLERERNQSALSRAALSAMQHDSPLSRAALSAMEQESAFSRAALSVMEQESALNRAALSALQNAHFLVDDE